VPEERMQLLRQAFDAIAVSPEAFADWARQNLPERFEWHPMAELPDNAVRHGPEECAALFAEIADLTQGYRPTPAEFVAAGDRVMIRVESRTEAKHGVEVAFSFTQIWDFAGNEPVRLREYLEHSQALGALEEPS
jgi:ketosteroid isomerase-like protein